MMASRQDKPSQSESDDAASMEESKASLPTTSLSTKRPRDDLTKCKICKTRLSRKGCSQFACLNCCSDADCEGHKDTREQSKWRQEVLAGTTMVQRKAAQKRSHSIFEKAFKEKNFAYMNQTILIWSLDEYMQHPKWRDDAIRKAEKRKVYANTDQKVVLKNSKKRFRAFMERKYRDSINK